MDDALKVKIILGSTRPNRFSDKPAAWIADIAKKKSGLDIETLDLRDFNLPMFNDPMSPSMVKDGAYPDDKVKAWAKKIGEADAFIIIAPEYNRSIPGVLKNALDSIYSEWNNKIVGYVAYGTVGGSRSVEHLRQVAVEQQMASVRQSVNIFAPWTLLDEKGALKPGSFDVHVHSADTMLEQIERWGRAFKKMRENK